LILPACQTALRWGLALVVLGGLGTPYVWLVARGLPDRGFATAAPVGLLLVAWLSWWLASLKLVPFSRGEVWLSAAVVGLGAAVIAMGQRAAFIPWLRRARGLVLLEASLFLIAFAAFAAIRSTNPDLWHPVLGGEKPMDFAFLNAVTRSSYFPPYDPWFAGGFINYCYFGFVLVASLIQATGVVPAVAYNLAIATWFAFVMLAAFGAVLGLVSATGAEGRVGIRSRPVLWALLGAVFVCVIGNLGEVTLVLDALQAQSDLPFRSVIPGYWPRPRTLCASADAPARRRFVVATQHLGPADIRTARRVRLRAAGMESGPTPVEAPRGRSRGRVLRGGHPRVSRVPPVPPVICFAGQRHRALDRQSHLPARLPDDQWLLPVRHQQRDDRRPVAGERPQSDRPQRSASCALLVSSAPFALTAAATGAFEAYRY
jgi:hypothetical protein